MLIATGKVANWVNEETISKDFSRSCYGSMWAGYLVTIYITEPKKYTKLYCHQFPQLGGVWSIQKFLATCGKQNIN